MAFWLFQYLKSLPPNFGIVEPDTVFRSAQPNLAKLEEYRSKYGIQAVLNLRDDAGEKEKTDARAAGLLWFWVPMSDKRAPDPKEVHSALGILLSGLPTLVCCKGGRHRTGVIIEVYRTVKGLSKGTAWIKERAQEEANYYGWYDHGGREAIRLWFENEFKPEDYE